MRIGYSMVLREMVPANSLDYGDCKDFQVVCPNCREATYKRVRLKPVETHYLAHYRASQADVSDCELRVAGISQQEVQRTNFQARGQQLHIFQDAIIDHIIHLIEPDDPTRAEQVIRRGAERLSRRKLWEEYARVVRRMAGSYAELPSEELGLPAALRSLPPYQRARQEGFARDMLSHIMAPGSVRLWNQSLWFATVMCESIAHRGLHWAEARPLLAPYLHALAYGNEKKIVKAHAQARGVKLPPQRDGNRPELSTYVAAMIMDRLFRIITQLDYGQMLREAAALTPPTKVSP